MMQPGRKYTNGSEYRYGFNGKEKKNEIYGEGKAYDFGNRIYDSRIGRWYSLDRYENIGWSLYSFAVNNPIQYIDKGGDIQKDPNGKVLFTPVSNSITLLNPNANQITMYLDNGQGYLHVKVQVGYIWTDRGNPILVYKVLGKVVDEYEPQVDKSSGVAIPVKTGKTKIEPIESDSYYRTNCFGKALAKGEYYIVSNLSLTGSAQILNDEYKLIKNGNVKNNFKFQEGDVLDLGSVDNGKMSYGNHYITATGKTNLKGEALFESHYSLDMRGTITGTFEEIAKSVEENDGAAVKLKNAKVYRYSTPYPSRNGRKEPVKSPEGKKTEEHLNANVDLINQEINN